MLTSRSAVAQGTNEIKPVLIKAEVLFAQFDAQLLKIAAPECMYHKRHKFVDTPADSSYKSSENARRAANAVNTGQIK